MTKAEIHAHKEEFSKGWKRKDSAWNTNTRAMEKKTVLRRLLIEWGYFDPSDQAMLYELEQDDVVDMPILDVSDKLDVDEAFPPEEDPAPNGSPLEQMGFKEDE